MTERDGRVTNCCFGEVTDAPLCVCLTARANHVTVSLCHMTTHADQCKGSHGQIIDDNHGFMIEAPGIKLCLPHIDRTLHIKNVFKSMLLNLLVLMCFASGSWRWTCGSWQYANLARYFHSV